jgi:hypothetical protein
VVGVILEAIVKDGDEKVLAGTKAYAESLDDPKFASDPYKFFSQFAYRREWKRGEPTKSTFSGIGALLKADAEDAFKLADK